MGTSYDSCDMGTCSLLSPQVYISGRPFVSLLQLLHVHTSVILLAIMSSIHLLDMPIFGCEMKRSLTNVIPTGSLQLGTLHGQQVLMYINNKK